MAARKVKAERALECLDVIERRLSEGQGNQPWCGCEVDLRIVREERQRLRVERVPKRGAGGGR